MQVNSANNNDYYMDKQQRQPVKELDKDAFLQIMIAQLKYQDPTSPMDNDKMVEQMAQFTTLEQLTNLGSSIEKMLSLQQFSYGSALIGSKVTLNDGEQSFSGEVQKVTMDSEGIKVWVEDKSYSIDQITAVERGATSGTEELLQYLEQSAQTDTASADTNGSSSNDDQTGSDGEDGSTE